MLLQLPALAALLSALTAVSGTPLLESPDNALYARDLVDAEVPMIFARELFRRMFHPPPHSPTGTTPPLSPVREGDDAANRAKMEQSYNHGETHNPEGNPGGQKDMWQKAPHNEVAEQAKKGPGRTLEQNLPSSHQNPADPKSPLAGASKQATKEGWDHASDIHADKQKENNPGGTAHVHGTQPPHPDAASSVYQQREKPNLVSGQGAQKGIVGHDLNKADPNSKNAQWDDHKGTGVAGDKGLPNAQQYQQKEAAAKTAAQRASSPAAPAPKPPTTPGNVPNAAAAAAKAAMGGKKKARRDLGAIYDAYYREALLRRALEVEYAY